MFASCPNLSIIYQIVSSHCSENIFFFCSWRATTAECQCGMTNIPFEELKLAAYDCCSKRFPLLFVHFKAGEECVIIYRQRNRSGWVLRRSWRGSSVLLVFSCDDAEWLLDLWEKKSANHHPLHCARLSVCVCVWHASILNPRDKYAVYPHKPLLFTVNVTSCISVWCQSALASGNGLYSFKDNGTYCIQ